MALMYAHDDGEGSVAALAVWVTLSILVLGHLALGLLTTSAIAGLLARLVYLFTAAASAFASGFVVLRTQKDTRVRAMWLLAALAALALAAEFVAPLRVLALRWLGLSSLQTEASLNIIASIALVTLLTIGGSLDRLGWRRSVRVALDSVTVAVLVFVSLLAYGAHIGLAVTRPEAVWLLELATYACIGALTAGSALLSLLGMRRLMKRWERLLAYATLAFGVGMTGSPVLNVIAMRREVPVRLEIAYSTTYMVGYAMFIAAALTWLFSSAQEAHLSAPAPLSRTAWPTMLVSTSVFLAVGALAFAVIQSPPGSISEWLFFGGLIVSTTCMVVRTALSASELAMLREYSAVDDTTGVFNSRRLSEKIEESLAATRRFGERFMVAVVDLDDFSEFNVASGVTQGDAMLGRVARLLKRQVIQPESVFRLSGDEFVVVVPVGSAREADRLCRHILVAVDSLRAEGPGVTASVGYALCPEDARDAEELLSAAHGAKAWSKHHGKHRHVRYDKTAMRALGDDRIRNALGGKTHLDVAHALSAAADARDPANYRHSRNVAALVCLMSETLGLDAEHANRLEVAALLHDVGKLALPDTMLGGRTLSIRERRSAKEHSELGEKLLESLALEGVGSWVRSHHERWDGTGYPDGLSGEAIPLESRIIALADSYDSMTVGYKYGAPMSKAAALQEVDLGIGAAFDPELAERFIAAVGSTDVLGWSDEWTAA